MRRRVAALLAVAAALGACGGGPSPSPRRAGISLEHLVRAVAFGEGSVWAALEAEGKVVRIDPEAGAVTDSILVDGQPRDVALGEGAAWVTSRGSVSKIDPGTNRSEVVRRFDARVGSPGVAVGAGSVWAIGPDETVLRIDPASGDVVETVDLPSSGRVVAFGEGSLWIGMSNSDVARVDPVTNRVEGTVEAGLGVSDIAVGSGAVWAVGESSAEVVRIDPEAVRVEARIPVGNAPRPIDASGDEVWVGVDSTSEIASIDPDADEVSKRVPLAEGAGIDPFAIDIAIGGGDVWVAIIGGRVVQVDPATGRLGP